MVKKIVAIVFRIDPEKADDMIDTMKQDNNLDLIYIKTGYSKLKIVAE